MSNTVQNAVVVAIGAAALVYLLWRWIGIIKNKKGSSCGCGCECPSCHRNASGDKASQDTCD